MEFHVKLTTGQNSNEFQIPFCFETTKWNLFQHDDLLCGRV